MCKLKSAIAFKDRIFMPDYDSHSRMLEELGIKDDYLGASKKFVRVELSPADGDVFSDIDGWELTVDQDIRPEWFSEDECKAKMIEAVKEWAKTYLHIGIDGLKITSGENHVIKDCKNVEISGSATVENICGSATVKNICGSATVERICDSATVKNICGSATVKNICGSATVERICDSATVKYICDSATVKNICGSATVKNICGSATVERICDSATVKYICGSATVEYICGSATVERICDSATVKYIYGSATVKYIYGSATVERICDSATVKNIYGSATVERICDSATVISHPFIRWNGANNLIISDNATFKDNYNKKIYQSGDFKLISVESGKKIGDMRE